MLLVNYNNSRFHTEMCAYTWLLDESIALLFFDYRPFLCSVSYDWLVLFD